MDSEFQDLEGLSPEMIQQLIELGVIDEQKGDIGAQLQQANSIRNSPLPEGRDSGRVYTAAHPLEFAATAAKSIMAGKDAKALQQKQAALLDKQNQARQMYVNQLLQRGQQRDMGMGPGSRDEGIL